VTLNQQALDVNYRVSYVDVSPPMKHLHPDKCNYVEATTIAIQGVKEYPNIFIWDGDTQVIVVESKGVDLINSDIDHPHHQEHLKIKLELDKAWYEKRIQPFGGKRVVE
jgi:hypothetical protein